MYEYIQIKHDVFFPPSSSWPRIPRGPAAEGLAHLQLNPKHAGG